MEFGLNSHHCLPRLGSVTGRDQNHTKAQHSNTLTAADMPRATRIPRENPRTTTTSLYDSELLRRSFSLDSADSVSETELISYSLSEKQMREGERKSAKSMMDYGFSSRQSSRLHDFVSQMKNQKDQRPSVSDSGSLPLCWFPLWIAICKEDLGSDNHVFRYPLSQRMLTQSIM